MSKCTFADASDGISVHQTHCMACLFGASQSCGLSLGLVSQRYTSKEELQVTNMVAVVQ